MLGARLYATGCILSAILTAELPDCLLSVIAKDVVTKQKQFVFSGRVELWLTVLPSAHLHQNYISFEKFLEKIYA